MKKINKLLLLLVAVALIAVCFVGCTAKTYTVTFKNGETTVATTTVKEGGTVYSANIAVSEGVVFDGWFTDEGRTSIFEFDTPVTNDLTLYAKFTTNLYSITYNLGGATGTVPIQQSVNANGSFTVTNTVPIWVGYEFKGWSDGSDLYHADDEYTVKGTDSVVLTAKWEYKTVHVSFYDGDGVKMESFEKDLPYGSDVVAPTADEVPVPNFCFVQKGWINAEGEEIYLENITTDTDFYATYDYVSSDLSLFKFKLNSDGNSYSIAAKNSNISGRIALPNFYNNLPVRTVAKQGFAGCYQMTMIYIPETYRTIKAEAFYRSNLAEVYIEEGLKTIEACAFQRVGMLTLFQLPASVDDIHWWGVAAMFDMGYYQWLEPQERELIDNFAFTTAEDGFYVWNDNDKMLYGDNGKQLVFVSPSVTELTVKESVKTIFPAICADYSKLTSVTIKGDVIDIGPAAFYYCFNLKEVTITGSVSNLWGSERHMNESDGVAVPEHGVFFSTAISTINLPTGIKHIGLGTFFWCSLLTEISIANTIEYISEQAFENGWVNQTNSQSEMGAGAGGLKSITMTGGTNAKYYFDANKAIIEKGTGIEKGDGTKGDTLLYYCMNAAGTEYSISADVTSFTPFAFAFNENLTTLTIPEGVEEIPCGFAQCAISLTTVNIPASVKRMVNLLPTEGQTWGNVSMWGNYGAFLMCEKLTSMIFADNSKLEFLSAASINNVGLETLILPKSIKTIEPFAIFGKALTSVTVEEGNDYFCSDDNGILFTKDMKTLVSYPTGKIAEEYTVPDGVEVIRMAAFNVCTNLRKVTMGADVKEIGMFAFNECVLREYDEQTWEIISQTGLEEVVMNEELKIINDDAFYSCYALKKITFTGSAPKLVEGGTRNIFGYETYDQETYQPYWKLFDNLTFDIPTEYIRNYYLEWYNFRPSYVDGFDPEIIPSITYTFNTKGGSAIENEMGVLVTDMPIPTKADAYFHGWYAADCDVEGIFNEETRITSFPYLFKGEGTTTTLYARWEEIPFQNGQKDIWAYILTPDKYIIAQVTSGAYTWFAFTPTVDCYAKLYGLEMMESWEYYCFNAIGVDVTKDGWWDYVVYNSLNGFGLLEAGKTYYFMFINNDTTDYTTYVTVKCFDETGDEMEMLAAILPLKFDLV